MPSRWVTTDGITLSVIRYELSGYLPLKVQKVQQPGKRELVFSVWNPEIRERLVLSMDGQEPFFGFSDVRKENPAAAPGFCLGLRKRLEGGQLVSLRQEGLDRVLYLDFDGRDDFGGAKRYVMVFDMAGREQNIGLYEDELLVASIVPSDEGRFEHRSPYKPPGRKPVDIRELAAMEGQEQQAENRTTDRSIVELVGRLGDQADIDVTHVEEGDSEERINGAIRPPRTHDDAHDVVRRSSDVASLTVSALSNLLLGSEGAAARVLSDLVEGAGKDLVRGILTSAKQDEASGFTPEGAAAVTRILAQMGEALRATELNVTCTPCRGGGAVTSEGRANGKLGQVNDPADGGARAEVAQSSAPQDSYANTRTAHSGPPEGYVTAEAVDAINSGSTTYSVLSPAIYSSPKGQVLHVFPLPHLQAEAEFDSALEASREYRERVTHAGEFQSYLAQADALHRKALRKVQSRYDAQTGDLARSADYEKYRVWARLIDESGKREPPGASEIAVTDYRADPPAEVVVPLDPKRSSGDNARAYYRMYAKAARAEKTLRDSLDVLASNLKILAEIRDALDRAADSADVSAFFPQLEALARREGISVRPGIGRVSGARGGGRGTDTVGSGAKRVGPRGARVGASSDAGSRYESLNSSEGPGAGAARGPGSPRYVGRELDGSRHDGRDLRGCGPGGPRIRSVDGPDGATFFIGGSAKENDELITRVRLPGDVWFHAKGVKGAHVLARPAGKGLTDEAILCAAKLAAQKSGAKDSPKAEVDYVDAMKVRKPRGSPPGFVTFTGQRTIMVETGA